MKTISREVEGLSKIIHRDLKPDNILIAKNVSNGRFLKLCDFGLATVHDKYIHNNTQYKHTKEVGDVHYMAPEVIQGRKYDHKSDIYSLALIGGEIFDVDVSCIDTSNTQLIKQCNLGYTYKKTLHAMVIVSCVTAHESHGEGGGQGGHGGKGHSSQGKGGHKHREGGKSRNSNSQQVESTTMVPETPTGTGPACNTTKQPKEHLQDRHGKARHHANTTSTTPSSGQ
ncbi:unnamed protein product [Oppiella nova]|uniref:Protein kinase domain-containing protein n=1 Tax=Oppiella nova TaxID=334625 RepID=A0A7R9LZY2_9ACAR|nr:unnamed protein product [Oppiella nova]CAG2168617.1 unnamed protein product [Oppiella nova]